MIKRKQALLLTMLLIGVSSLTACGNKDTAVIVNIQDKGNDSSQNKVVNSDSKAKDNKKEDNTKDESIDNKQEEAPVEITLKLKGKWIDNNDNIYYFKNNNEYYGYNANEEKDLFGTYESDESTYVNINITKDNGTAIDNKLAYTISEITKEKDQDSSFEDSEKVVVTLISGETQLKLTKVQEEVEEEEDTSKNTDSNTDSNTDKNKNNGVVVKELDGQELENVRQQLQNMGINPDTGLTFEEEALTPPAEDLPDGTQPIADAQSSVPVQAPAQ